MRLERRHFKWIASIIETIPDDKTRVDIAELFAGACAQTNDHFKQQRFLEACDAVGDDPFREDDMIDEHERSMGKL